MKKFADKKNVLLFLCSLLLLALCFLPWVRLGHTLISGTGQTVVFVQWTSPFRIFLGGGGLDHWADAVYLAYLLSSGVSAALGFLCLFEKNADQRRSFYVCLILTTLLFLTVIPLSFVYGPVR